MSRPFTLQPLLDLMQTRTDEATRRLGRLIAAEQSARSRLELLEQYREEYAQRYRDNRQEQKEQDEYAARAREGQTPDDA